MHSGYRQEGKQEYYSWFLGLYVLFIIHDYNSFGEIMSS